MKIVRLKVYIIFASPPAHQSWHFIQWYSLMVIIISVYFSYGLLFKLRMAVDLNYAWHNYILCSCSLRWPWLCAQWLGRGKQIQRRIFSTIKHAISMLGKILFHMTLTLKTFIWLDHLVLISQSCDKTRVRIPTVKNVAEYVVVRWMTFMDRQ